MKFPLFLVILLLAGCSRLPGKKLSQWKPQISCTFQDDSLKFAVGNPLRCPIGIHARSSDGQVQEILGQHFPLQLGPLADTVLALHTGPLPAAPVINVNFMMGDPASTPSIYTVALPFPRHRSYRIIQGYNGQFSHSSDYSRFALDIDLAVGDTVCAAADGFVVGVIDEYRRGSKSEKWRDYANYITIFHPEMNCFTQYVHLQYKGSLVRVGDEVQAGQPIGLSGKTGWTTVEHLHFNVLAASPDGLISVPVSFQGGYEGTDLKRGDVVKH